MYAAQPTNVEGFFTTKLSPDEPDERVTFIFDNIYNTMNDISSYVIEPRISNPEIECRTPKCPNISSCQCTGLRSRLTFFNITPRNCGDRQAGLVATVAICK